MLKLTPTFADQPFIAYPPMNLNPSPQVASPPAALKVAIVGTAPSSRMLAPFDDPSWEIWVCSPGNMNICPRVTRWFEIHSNLLWPEHEHYGKPYLEWLSKQTFPVYMQDNKLVARATPLPKEELVAEFGPYFFTSSFSWMLAKAIKDGAKEIALYGVDMASKDEYILQRSGGHYFIQVARQRGIKVTLPHESDLDQPPGLYGFTDSTPFGRKLAARIKELRDRLAGAEQQRTQLDQSILYFKGALEDIEYVSMVWGGAMDGTRGK